MASDQIAAIRPMIAELEDAAANSEGGFVATFQISGHPAKWVEVILGTVNFAYPYADDPLERLLRQGIQPLPKLKLSQWQPDLFATFDYESSVASRDVAKFVDRIFSEILGGGAGYEVDAGINRLAN